MNSFDDFTQYIVDQPFVQDQVSDNEIVHWYLGNPRIKVTEIAARSGYSLPEVYKILRRNYVEPCRLRRNEPLVLHYAEAGYPVSQIAQLTGYTTRNVRYIIARKQVND